MDLVISGSSDASYWSQMGAVGAPWPVRQILEQVGVLALVASYPGLG